LPNVKAGIVVSNGICNCIDLSLGLGCQNQTRSSDLLIKVVVYATGTPGTNRSVLYTTPGTPPVCGCRYLQEIGYTDAIIDVRSARIRQMLGLPSHDAASDAKAPVSSDHMSGKRVIETQGNG